MKPLGDGAGAARVLSSAEGRLRIEGSLDFGSVGRVFAETRDLFPPSARLMIDLGGVTAANSAALALLLEWMELAAGRGTALSLCNLPEGIARIAALSDLDTLLPVADDAGC
jgi:phospholipid transport system transporter-binding protein